MLELFFLGTSAGSPSVERGMPCIALRWKGRVLLWDVGECCQRELMKAKVGYGSVEHIFISHLHMDHFLGIYGLIETLRMVAGKEALWIHAPEGMEELLINRWPFLRVGKLKPSYAVDVGEAVVRAVPVRHPVERGRAFGFVFEERERRKFYAEKAHALGIRGRLFREIEEKGFVEVGGKRVDLDEVSYLKKGRKVAYSGDARYSPAFVKAAEGADVMIHDATFHSSLEKEAKERGHATAADAGKAAAEAGAKKLILTHISARYRGKEELLIEDAAQYFEGPIEVAYDGMVVRL